MREFRLALAYGGFGENQASLKVRSSKIGTCLWVYWRRQSRSWQSQLWRHPLVQPVAEQPPELSRRRRRTEGLSDKYFLYGEFGENQAFLRVRSSRLAFSLWCTVGRAACLPPQEPNVRLCISHRRSAANGKHPTIIEEKRSFSTSILHSPLSIFHFYI